MSRHAALLFRRVPYPEHGDHDRRLHRRSRRQGLRPPLLRIHSRKASSCPKALRAAADTPPPLAALHASRPACTLSEGTKPPQRTRELNRGASSHRLRRYRQARTRYSRSHGSLAPVRLRRRLACPGRRRNEYRPPCAKLRRLRDARRLPTSAATDNDFEHLHRRDDFGLLVGPSTSRASRATRASSRCGGSSDDRRRTNANRRADPAVQIRGCTQGVEALVVPIEVAIVVPAAPQVIEARHHARFSLPKRNSVAPILSADSATQLRRLGNPLAFGDSQHTKHREFRCPRVP